jgi:uncharacterized protein YecT (DUF1311 family)
MASYLIVFVAATSLILSWHTPTLAADMFDTGYEECAVKASTPDIVACVTVKTKLADLALNNAYSALASGLAPSRKETLRKAERLWLQFRDANCQFYGSTAGTIARVQAVECLRAMTLTRAHELELAGQP